MKSIQMPQLQKIMDFLKQYRYVILMIIVGIILLRLPTGESGEELNLDVIDTALLTAGSQQEVEGLEERLSEVLSQIAGAGETTVILTVEDSGQKILAENLEQSDNDAVTETVILSDTSRGETVVELQTISPTYRGALIISQGAGSAAVQLELIAAVSVLTGLPSNKIAVCAAG